MTALELMRSPAASLPLRSVRSRLGRTLKAIPIVVFGLYVFVGAIGPLIVEYSSVGGDLSNRLLPPGSVISDGTMAVLGTDALGRDLLGQVIYGARTSITIGLVVVISSGLVGTVVGTLAGYRRGVTDLVVSRIIDVLLAFPGILLAIVIAGVFDRSMFIVVVALSITNWVGFARLSRSMAMSLREREWVKSAFVMGVSQRTIVVRHVLPFLAGPIAALATTEFAGAIVAEASLSFLGLGLPSSSVSWGQTIASGREYLASAWWISAIPGIALALLVVSIGITGDRFTRHVSRRQ